MNEFEEQLLSVLNNLKYLGNGEDLSILERIDENTKRIADALEHTNKLFIDFMAYRKAEHIVQELKAENDGLRVVEEVTIGDKDDLFLDVEIKNETEKAYLIRHLDTNLVAWIPKKAVNSKRIAGDNVGTITIAHWFKNKLEWKEDEKNESM